MSRDPKDGVATSWETKHFESSPTDEQLRQLKADEAAQKAKTNPPLKGVSYVDAAKTIKREDFSKVHMIPCAREGFLSGIGGGAVLGGLRYIFGAPIPKAANWAFGGWMVISFAAYEYCRSNRRTERAQMKRVVEVYEKKQAEMKQKEQERIQRREQERAREEAARLASRAWYKFW